MGQDLQTIGAVAEATGVTVSALRYYDELGLITPASRIGGKRYFDPDVLGRVNFIQRAKNVGFSLEEIQKILDDKKGDWNQLVENKLGELNDQRNQLDVMINLLTEIRNCGCEVVVACPKAVS